MYNSTFKYKHTSLPSKFSNSKGRMTVQHKIPNEWHKQQHKNIHYYLSNLSTSEHKKWKHINIEGDIMQCAICATNQLLPHLEVLVGKVGS